METLHPRIRAYDNHLLGSQKFDLLEDGPKIESMTGQMVVILIGI
jgi:hypothetical protein